MWQHNDRPFKSGYSISSYVVFLFGSITIRDLPAYNEQETDYDRQSHPVRKGIENG